MVSERMIDVWIVKHSVGRVSLKSTPKVGGRLHTPDKKRRS